MFEAPKGRWEILPVWRASAEHRRYDFLDLYSIEEFLRRHMFDFGVMMNLRQLLAPMDAGPPHRRPGHRSHFLEARQQRISP